MPTGPRPAPPAGTARVAITGTIFGHHCTTVFWLTLTGGSITTADLNTLASAIATEWNAQPMSNLSADYAINTVTISYIPTAGTELIGVWSGSHAGAYSGTTIADASACFVVDWKITARYRGGHPRSYLPGVVTATISSGSLLSGGQVSNLITSLGVFLGYMNAYTAGGITGCTMGTVAFARSNAWLTPPQFKAFTGVAIGKTSKLGSQRRRILA